MLTMIAKWLLNALALYIVAQVVPGVRLLNFSSALVAVCVISLANVFIKPVLFIFTLPITILTLGLFTFVLNALMLLIAGSITPGFEVDGFVAALLGSLLLTIVSGILESFVR